MAESTFRDYVLDAEHMKWYGDYQQKYARTIRESDKVLIELVREVTRDAIARGESPELLDIGCSTGNLLLHLKGLVPGLRLVGGDMAPEIIAGCRQNAELGGISFAEMNMLQMPPSAEFDVIVANAALMFFTAPELQTAVSSLATALKPGGAFLAFDLFHPFDQEVTIVETTQLHPRGLTFYFRPYSQVRDIFAAAGLTEPTFEPFYVPIDLPKPSDPADVTSYTVPDANGRRMAFRGTLFQPWCHIRSGKAR